MGNFSQNVYTIEKIDETLGQKYYYVESIDRAYLRFELLKVDYFLLIKVLLRKTPKEITHIYIYISREMFTHKQQDEIINDFLDVIKVSDYIRESREKQDKCKCKDCKKKHERYCTLYELPLPENMINNIYGFTYRCWRCEEA